MCGLRRVAAWKDVAASKVCVCLLPSTQAAAAAAVAHLITIQVATLRGDLLVLAVGQARQMGVSCSRAVWCCAVTALVAVTAALPLTIGGHWEPMSLMGSPNRFCTSRALAEADQRLPGRAAG